jgi:hypothetical protein
MINFCALRLRSGSKNLCPSARRSGQTFDFAQGKKNPVAERSRSAGFLGKFYDQFLRPSTPLREQKFSPSASLRVKKFNRTPIRILKISRKNIFNQKKIPLPK